MKIDLSRLNLGTIGDAHTREEFDRALEEVHNIMHLEESDGFEGKTVKVKLAVEFTFERSKGSNLTTLGTQVKVTRPKRKAGVRSLFFRDEGIFVDNPPEQLSILDAHVLPREAGD